MNKKELHAFMMLEFKKEPNVPKYILSSFKENIHYSYYYNKQVYCAKTDTVLVEENLIKIINSSAVCCPHCKDNIYVNELGNLVRKSRTNLYFFAVIDFKNNCLIRNIYAYELIYSFKNMKMNVDFELYKIGIDVFDSISKIELHSSCRLYFSSYGARVFNFKKPFYVNRKKSIYYALDRVENINTSSFPPTWIGDFCLNRIKKTILKYYDGKNILKKDYYEFLITLLLYPKLETIYKDSNYKCEQLISFFRKVIDLKRRGKYPKYDYLLMKIMYENDKFLSDFYLLNITLGKPYVSDLIISFCGYFNELPKVLKTRKTFIYMSNLKNHVSLYRDYITIINNLNYEYTDKLLYPKDLLKAHDELNFLYMSKINTEMNKKLESINENYNLLEFEKFGYSFHLPKSEFDFKYRGKYLSICLYSANYYERYENRRTIILFCDNVDHARINTFVAELSINDLSIIQFHGFSNDVNCSDEQRYNREKAQEILMKKLKTLTIKDKKIVEKKSRKRMKGILRNENQYQMLRL